MDVINSQSTLSSDSRTSCPSTDTAVSADSLLSGTNTVPPGDTSNAVCPAEPGTELSHGGGEIAPSHTTCGVAKRPRSNNPGAASAAPAGRPYPMSSADSMETSLNRLGRELRALDCMLRQKEREWNGLLRLRKLKEESFVRLRRQRQTLAILHGEEAPPPPSHISHQSQAGDDRRVGGVIMSTPPIHSLPNQSQIHRLIEKFRPIAAKKDVADMQQKRPLDRSELPSAPVRPPTSHSSTAVLLNGTHNSALTVSDFSATERYSNGARSHTSDSVTSLAVTHVTARASASPATSCASGCSPDVASSSSAERVLCQGCCRKPAQFLCAGCGKQWYCSRACQIEAWDTHAENCSV